MKKKPTSGLYATIDIGSTSVKAIVVETTEKGNRLLKAAAEKLSISSQSTEENNNLQITNAISKLATNLELEKCQKITSLFYNRELQAKIIDLPSQIKASQLSRILMWEAKKLLSSHYKDKEFAFAYSIIKEEPLSVALVVVPQTLLESHLKLFEGTGIKPTAVYTDVFAALALRPIVDLAGLPALSILHFGNSGTHLQIFSAGKLKFYRFIPSGTVEMSNPPSEGELEMYFQKIRFSFDYFRAVSKLNQVDAMYFMGGGSQFGEVIPYAKNYFAPTQVHTLDISSALDISPVMSSMMSERMAAQDKSSLILKFIPAVGACLADFDEKSENMNLLTRLNSIEKEKQKERIAKILPYIFGIMAVILSACILAYMYTQKAKTLEEIQTTNSFIKNEIKTCEIKINNLSPKKSNDQINLCANSQKALEPALKGKRNLHTLYMMSMRLREKGMKIQDILVRTRQEADQIMLKPEPKDIFGEGIEEIEEDANGKFSSKIATIPSEDQIKENFEGNIAIIHGIAETPDQISLFTEGLTTSHKDKKGNPLPQPIKRVISLTTQKISQNRVEFMMKGEL